MTNRPPGYFEGTEMPDALWWEALWPNPADVLAKVGVKLGMEVIDLCSGDGWFTLQIAKVASHVIAIDIDPAQVEMARRRLENHGVTNCDFVAGDAYELSRLWPRPVDFVFLANAFHGVPDRKRLARAVRNVLVPGGVFAIVNWHPIPREETTVLGEPRGPRSEMRMHPWQTSAPVEDAGLRTLQVVDLPPYHYGVVFQRLAS